MINDMISAFGGRYLVKALPFETGKNGVNPISFHGIFTFRVIRVETPGPSSALWPKSPGAICVARMVWSMDAMSLYIVIRKNRVFRTVKSENLTDFLRR